MKPQQLQQKELKEQFKDVCKSLSTPASLGSGKEYREALDERMSLMGKMFNENIITAKAYSELCMADDFSVIPDCLK